MPLRAYCGFNFRDLNFFNDFFFDFVRLGLDQLHLLIFCSLLDILEVQLSNKKYAQAFLSHYIASQFLRFRICNYQ